MKNSRMLVAFLSILSFPLIASAQEKKKSVEVIQLEKYTPESIKLSKFTKGMEVLQLETKDECLLTGLVDIQFIEDYIFVRDVMYRGIYIFDKTGKYLTKFSKHGQGPGEYIDISDFWVDLEKNELTIFTGSKGICQLLIYDLKDHQYIREETLPIASTSKIERIEDTYYFITNCFENEVNNKKTNSEIIAYHIPSKRLTPLFNTIIPEDKSFKDGVHRWSIDGVSKHHADRFYFSKIWHNQFYEIKDQKAKPILAVDGGTKEVSDRVKRGDSYIEQQKFMDSNNVDVFHFYNLRYYQNPKNFIFGYLDGHKPGTYRLFIRQDGKDVVALDYVNDFMEGNPRLNQLGVIGNQCIYTINPWEEHPEEIEALLKSRGIEEESNPIFLLFELK